MFSSYLPLMITDKIFIDQYICLIMFVPALFVSSEKIRHQNKKIIGVKIPFTLVNRQTEKVSNFVGYSWLQNKSFYLFSIFSLIS